MKKLVRIAVLICMSMCIFACAKTLDEQRNTSADTSKTQETKKAETESKDKYEKLTEDFYNEYFAELDNFDDDFVGRLNKVKQKYMTDTLIKELEIRSIQHDSDAIIEAQDNYGMLETLQVKKGKKANTVIAYFDQSDTQNGEKRVFNIHFIEKDGQTLMDTYDTTVIRKDLDGNLEEIEYRTKWANKDKLSSDDINEMESIMKQHEENLANGYID